MEFDWMTSIRRRPNGASVTARADMAHKELRERAALFFRLGYSKEQAIKRLCDNVAWDREVGDAGGPSEDEVRKLVTATYNRRPSR